MYKKYICPRIKTVEFYVRTGTKHTELSTTFTVTEFAKTHLQQSRLQKSKVCHYTVEFSVILKKIKDLLNILLIYFGVMLKLNIYHIYHCGGLLSAFVIWPPPNEIPRSATVRNTCLGFGGRCGPHGRCGVSACTGGKCVIHLRIMLM